MRAIPTVTQNNSGVGSVPVGPAPKKRGPAAWLVALILLLIAIVILLLLLSRCGGSSDDSHAPAASTAPGATSTASTTPADATVTGPDITASSSISTGAGPNSGDGEDGTITAGSGTMLPLTGSPTASLAAYSGQRATATSVQVQSVPADEGFWVGSSSGDRIWVQLTGARGESPFRVKQRDHVSFSGTTTPNGTGFAEKAGVTDTEGKTQLEAEGFHLSVPRSSLKLSTR